MLGPRLLGPGDFPEGDMEGEPVEGAGPEAELSHEGEAEGGAGDQSWQAPGYTQAPSWDANGWPSYYGGYGSGYGYGPYPGSNGYMGQSAA